MNLTHSDIRRYWSKVDCSSEEGCWEWMGGRFGFGHGAFSVRRSPIGAHRVAFWLSGRDQTPGLVIRHRCHNPGCVNPRHLEEGTQADNVADKVAAGRQARGSTHWASGPRSAEIRRILAEQKRGEKNPMSLQNPLSVDARKKLGNALRGREKS
jgi:hypothetical protein